MRNDILGLIAPQNVPFGPKGDVNYHEYSKLTKFLLANGVDGIFVGGTSGEFINLSDSERKQLLEIARDSSSSDTPIIFNATAMNLASVNDFCAFAVKAGADAVSFTAPYYHSYDKQALIGYFKSCADAAKDLPVYLYNIPGMTKNPITTDIIKAVCSSCPNIKGIKDSSMDFMTYMEFQNHKPFDDFKVMTGNDAQVLVSLFYGGDTAVIALAGVFPRLAKSIFENFWKGDLIAARIAQDKIMCVRELVRSIMPIVSHKEIPTFLGFDMGVPRYPFRSLLQEEKERLRRELDRLGLLP